MRILTRSMQNVARPHSRRAPEFTCSYMQFNRVLYRRAREFIRLTRAGRDGE